uniref:Uncharacterized protein n=1 Tax=Ananas comosus var. bracteatus TaxID=296719 RepID=A0A6V7NKM7_ANACO|nr:unnamed protein product [Ananas comosus var. bracteatus]
MARVREHLKVTREREQWTVVSTRKQRTVKAAPATWTEATTDRPHHRQGPSRTCDKGILPATNRGPCSSRDIGVKDSFNLGRSTVEASSAYKKVTWADKAGIALSRTVYFNHEETQYKEKALNVHQPEGTSATAASNAHQPEAEGSHQPEGFSRSGAFKGSVNLAYQPEGSSTSEVLKSGGKERNQYAATPLKPLKLTYKEALISSPPFPRPPRHHSSANLHLLSLPHPVSSPSRDYAVFLPEWVPAERLVRREVLNLGACRLRCYPWNPYHGARRPPLTYKVWIRLVSLPYECWSSRSVGALVGGFGRFIRPDDFSARMADLSGYRCLIAVNHLSDIPENLEITFGDLSISVLIQIGRWDRADAIGRGNQPNERSDQHIPDEPGRDLHAARSDRGRCSSDGGDSNSDASWNSPEIRDRRRGRALPILRDADLQHGPMQRSSDGHGHSEGYVRGRRASAGGSLSSDASPVIVGKRDETKLISNCNAADVDLVAHPIVGGVRGVSLSGGASPSGFPSVICRPTAIMISLRPGVEGPRLGSWSPHPVMKKAKSGLDIYFKPGEYRGGINSEIGLSSSTLGLGTLSDLQQPSSIVRMRLGPVTLASDRYGGMGLLGPGGPGPTLIHIWEPCSLCFLVNWGPLGLTTFKLQASLGPSRPLTTSGPPAVMFYQGPSSLSHAEPPDALVSLGPDGKLKCSPSMAMGHSGLDGLLQNSGSREVLLPRGPTPRGARGEGPGAHADTVGSHLRLDPTLLRTPPSALTSAGRLQEVTCQSPVTQVQPKPLLTGRAEQSRADVSAQV